MLQGSINMHEDSVGQHVLLLVTYACLQMYSVKAEMSAIQLIYLQCFFTSLTEYIFGRWS
jgi:hypothetical protein